jgi:hypothetical protein
LTTAARLEHGLPGVIFQPYGVSIRAELPISVGENLFDEHRQSLFFHDEILLDDSQRRTSLEAERSVD